MLTVEELQSASLFDLLLLADLYEIPPAPAPNLILTLSQLSDPDPGDLPLGSGLNDVTFSSTTSLRLILTEINLPTPAQAAIVRATLRGKLSSDPKLKYFQRRLVVLWEAVSLLKNALALLEQR